MRIIRFVLALGLLLVAAACGTPTETGSTGNGGEAGSGAAATQMTSEPGAAVEAITPDATAMAAVVEEKARQQFAAAPPMTIDKAKSYTATIETTRGTMKADLFASEAPITVNNFVFLARENFYDGIRFHRVVKGFMVQTGDPNGDGSGGPGYSFEDEPVTRDYTRGTLAMANRGPDTNGSQFFIVHADAPLDKNYTIFGQVTEGLEVLDAIANVPVGINPNMGEESAPREEIQIVDISVAES